MDITIRNTTFTVEPNYDHTLLKTVVDGQEITASTLPLLTKAITDLLAVPKAAVPVMSMNLPNSFANKTNRITFRRGVLTGVHAGNNNLLIQWEGQKSSTQLSGYRNEVMHELTPEQREELQRLWDKKQAAYEAYEAYESRFTINETTGRKLIKEYHLQREKEGGKSSKK